ncbi:MAG: hypothetical protein KKC51_10785, partial [Verrucomicrobia bacterium]|nr:hypothetical protein [Verrucomicrobiota bacterium]
YDGTLHIEQNKFTATAFFQDPAADYWFWDYLSAGSAQYGTKNFTLVASSLADESADAVLTVHLQGATSAGPGNDHHVQVSLNGTPIGEASWAGQAAHDLACDFSQALLIDGTNTVRIVALLDGGIPHSVVYVNSFDLSYRRRAEAANGQLILPAGETTPLTLGGFGGSSISVLDVRDPLQPLLLAGVTVADGKAGFGPASPGGVYVAYDPAVVPAPKSLAADTASAWKAAENAAEYVVVTPAEFAAAAQALVDRRAAEGLSVALVLLEDLYDEFNDGLAGPTVIRDFLAWAADHWQIPPAYVLLAGEGTYDYKGYLPATDNKIPVMMRGTPHGLYVSDSWFVDYDEDGVADVALGRLPASTAAELTTMINKIAAFEDGEGGMWRQQFLLAADNPDDAGDFPYTADSVSVLAPRDYETLSTYLATNTLAATRAALLAKLKAGAGHMTYFGHGGTDRLASEGLLKSTDVASLTNSTRLPVMVFLTCSAGQFPIPGLDCLAETLLLSSKGGASAVWAPSGLSYNSLARELAKAYYQAVFLNNQTRLGDACLQAYRQYADLQGAGDYLPSIYNLLGDPAMRLAGTAAINAAPTFDSWRNQFFTAAEQADPAVGQATSDSDADGAINLMEYALGWNPRTADGRDFGLRGTRFRDDPDYLWIFEYQRRRHVSDVDYLVDAASTLLTPAWVDALQSLVVTDVVDDGNGLTETVRLKIHRQTLAGANRLFLRLRVGR